MKSFEESFPAIHEFLRMASGVAGNRIILGNQGRAAPEGLDPYISYLPTPLRAYAWPEQSLKEVAPVEDYDPSLGKDWKDFEAEITTNWILNVSVTVFNRGADTIIGRLPHSYFRDDIIAHLYKNNVSVKSYSNVRNLTSIIQAGNQPRYNLDIEMWCQLDVTYNVLKASKIPFVIRDGDNDYIIAEG